MPLTQSSSDKAFSHNVAEMVRAGHPHKQALAAAYHTQRSAAHKAAGGPVVGLLRSPVAGRTDRLPIEVWEDSYVVPADVVSGWGQGNTEGGAQILDQMFNNHHQQGSKMAAGGRASLRKIPIVAAGGEYIVHPYAIRSFGGGDMQKGHKMLDKMVRKKRMATAKHMQRLPGPRVD